MYVLYSMPWLFNANEMAYIRNDFSLWALFYHRISGERANSSVKLFLFAFYETGFLIQKDVSAAY